MPIETDIRLVQRTFLAPDLVRLDFYSPELAGQFEAGQFIEIQTLGLIKRPFAVMAQNSQEGTLSVGIKVVGKNSALLASLSPGASLKAVGPLGCGFDWHDSDHLILVGGGSGIFPLLMTAHCAQEKGIESTLIFGFRSPETAIDKNLIATSRCEILFSSDTGGLDFKGHAGEALSHRFQSETLSEKTLLGACGPKPLLAFCKEFARQKGIFCQLSLEERMACGVGLCLGCVVDIQDEKGQLDRVRCCVDGPVFDAERVIL